DPGGGAGARVRRRVAAFGGRDHAAHRRLQREMAQDGQRARRAAIGFQSGCLSAARHQRILACPPPTWAARLIPARSPPMSAHHPVDPDDVRSAVAGALRAHSTFFLVEGIILLVLGVVAILLPPLATIAVTIIFGWIFLIAGLIGWITTFAAR